MGICSAISTKWLFIHCFQIALEFGSVHFCGGRKTGEPGGKSSQQGRQPATNSTHIRRRTRTSLVGGECSHYSAIPVPCEYFTKH